MWKPISIYQVLVVLGIVASGTAGVITYSFATFATQREYDVIRSDIRDMRHSVEALTKELKNNRCK